MMLKRRIIPVLLLKNGRMVKGKQFKDFRDTGDPVMATRVYNAQAADELVFLDIQASQEERGTLIETIERVSTEAFMPFSVGGGITSIQDIRDLLKAGADKVVITTAAVENPDLIAQGAEAFGKQCIIAGIDAKLEDGGYRVYTHSGTVRTDLDLIAHVKNMTRLGAGEIFINSIDRDGMMVGYDLPLIRMVSEATDRPVIAMGGAGNFQHLVEAMEAGAHAAACASVFHFGDNNPPRARAFVKNAGYPVKNIQR
ncbi:MAG: imidazole glycerol phosphate synthase cyclase subunit [Chthonomonadales bacterium]